MSGRSLGDLWTRPLRGKGLQEASEGLGLKQPLSAKMPWRSLGGLWEVSGMSLGLGGFWEVSGKSLERVWEVSGRSLKGKGLQRLQKGLD